MLYGNYHTHTKRCGHAFGEDEEYVKAAIDAGFRELGFTDHCPWPYKTGYLGTGTRMRMDELDGYIESINSLKDKYAGRIKIYTGLECEFYEEYIDTLKAMSRKVDYMIFGAHWIIPEENGQKSTGSITDPEVIPDVVDNMVKGMESGLFKCLNHPCHMLCSYPVFDDICQEASKRLCQTARRLSIPLEYNLYGSMKKDEGKFRGLGYPCPGFWEIAAETGCKAIIGVDAHKPSMLLDIERIEKAQDYLASLGMEVIDRLTIT